MSFGKKHTISGKGSIRLDITDGCRNIPATAHFSVTTMMRLLPGENLERFNRISLWIYVDSPAIANNFMELSIHNQEKHIMPLRVGLKSTHTLGNPTRRVAACRLGIPLYVYRDLSQVFLWQSMHTALRACAAVGITVYVDNMCLEQVEADHYKGFDLRAGAIAYCHSGYRPEVSNRLYAQSGSRGVLSAKQQRRSDVQGNCVPQANGLRQMVFPVKAERVVYFSGWKEEPSFPYPEGTYIPGRMENTERCFQALTCPNPYRVPHGCYEHPSDGRRLPVCGGWHDAGDLTQAAINTAESVFAMLELAIAEREAQPELSQRAKEEARWGLNWLMRTRWGDGYRHNGTVIGFWSDNIQGTLDDINADSGNRPFDNFMIAGVCAKAIALFRDEDPRFADWCARCAKEDFSFAMAAMQQSQDNESAGARYTQLQMNAQAAISAMELYEAFGETEYLSHGVSFARILMACQASAVEPQFSIPLRGYL